MDNKQCLNCEQVVSGNYCQNCGQKSNTHAITLKHFFFHDIIHGVFHLEKGILFTLKETFTRPGQAALDYIHGKRVNYYNVFGLALMLIALNILTVHYNHGINPPSVSKNTNEGIQLMNFLSNNVKIILFGFVPLLAINAFLIFKRLKINLAEHFIIAGINLLGILVMCLFVNLLSLLKVFEGIKFFIDILKMIYFLLIVLFPFWVYFNATYKMYSLLGFIWRIIVFYTLLFFEIVVILSLIAKIVTNTTSIKLHFNA
jgi:hypothetical protein